MNLLKRIALFAIIVSVPILSLASDFERLFSPAGQGTLPEKLVVTDMNALLYKDFSAKAEKIPPLTIFWRLKIDGAADSNDPIVEHDGKKYFCVGGPQGDELGYIETSRVTKWMTRFVFAPLPPKSDSVFRVFNKSFEKKDFEALKDSQVEDATIAQILETPPGCASFAFIINDEGGKATQGQGASDDPNNFKHVMIYNTPITDGVTGKAKPKGDGVKQEDVGLDVVFVIDTTGSMQPMIDKTKEVCQSIAKQVNSSASKNIHFGLVEYRDSEADDFGARVVCDLTQSYDAFLTRLGSLDADGGGDDPEDVILGMKTAISDAKWHKNTSKHIILVGDAKNKATKAAGALTNFKKLYDFANKDIGDDLQSKAFKRIIFHAIVGRDEKEVVDEFHEVSENCDEEPGYYGNMITDTNIANDMSEILRNGIRAVVSDDVPDDIVTGKGSVIAKSVWDLKKFVSKGQTVTSDGSDNNKALGFACARTNKEIKCAELNILVLRDEMEDFADALSRASSRLDKLLSGKGGNIKVIFDSFLEEFVGIASGSVTDEDYEMDLEKILGLQMPVKTKTLKKKIKDVMRMSDKERAEWMKDIKDARDRAKAILNKKEAWVDTYDKQKFAFIPTADLP